MCDTSKTDEDTAVIIAKTVIGLHPGPHALLYVLKIDRFTAEEYQVFKKLEGLFDERLTEYLIVVFTGGDNFEHDGTTAEEVIESAPETLKQLLADCHYRYLVFNNRAQDKRPQVERLLAMVRSMVKANGEHPHYRCPKYDGLGEGLEREVRSRVAGVEKRFMQEKEVFKQQIAEKEQEMEDALKQKDEEYRKKIANKEMSEEQARRKMKEMEEKQEKEKQKMAQQLKEMDLKHKRELEENMRAAEKAIKKETVEAGGMISTIKNGIKTVGSGALDIISAPLEKVASWFG